MVTPTIYRRTLDEAKKLYVPVIKPESSREIRYLMRLNALEGSGTRMNKFANGYRVGGKTGTAQAVGRRAQVQSCGIAVQAGQALAHLLQAERASACQHDAVHLAAILQVELHAVEAVRDVG